LGCGSEFSGRRKQAKYCTTSCYRRTYIRSWKKKYPDRIKELNKKSLQKVPKEIQQDRYLKKTYGITLEQYNKLLVEQNYSCYICQKSITEFKKRLAVDHNHKTGEIRGLLCMWCNKALGLFHDKIGHFYRASLHLQRKTGWFVPVTRKRKKIKTNG
jgi:hypothetical protein